MSDCSRTKLMRRVQQHSFAAIELQLYLDTHPGDCRMLDALRRALCARRAAVREYENSAGALTYDGLRESARYDWIDRPWPWEKEG